MKDRRKLLLVVDMQHDFVDGVFGSPAAAAIVPKVIEKIKNWPGLVIFTRDSHGDYEWEKSARNEECKIFPPHCIWDWKAIKKGETIGYSFVDGIKELAEADEDMIYEKSDFSYEWWGEWEKPKLDLFSEIEIVGLCTDICVLSNALVLRAVDGYMPITVDASCCAGSSPEAHAAALLVMKNNAINVINED